MREFYERGARYMGLAHNGHNQLADSLRRDDSGRAERRDQRARPRRDRRDEPVGMMVDVSHLSRTAALQATALSRAPVIASHSAVRALADHRRNLDDEQLLA